MDGEAIAQRLLDEHRNGERFHPLAEAGGLSGIADAYAVQGAFVKRRFAAARSAPAGYKIGLTSKRMQEMCRIDMPIAGVIADRTVHESGVGLQLEDFGRLGLEFEICVVMGADLPACERAYTAEEVAAAVASVAASVELVDDRNCDYATLDVLSLVADNSWNAGVVLGATVPVDGIDLVGCQGVVFRDGVEIDRGHGRDALGGPMVPLEWLANHLREQGGGLKAGEIVMTGSLIPTQFPTLSHSYRFAVDGIGEVALSVTA